MKKFGEQLVASDNMENTHAFCALNAVTQPRTINIKIIIPLLILLLLFVSLLYQLIIMIFQSRKGNESLLEHFRRIWWEFISRSFRFSDDVIVLQISEELVGVSQTSVCF